MGAILSKIAQWLSTYVVPAILTWAWNEFQKWRQKREDDKRVQDAVDKAKDEDLEKGLEGTEELEDGFNENAK